MSNPRKGARIVWRGDSRTYIIRDGGRRISTRTSSRAEAERSLASYIAQKDRPKGGPRPAHDFTVSAALTAYLEEHAPAVADPARIGHAVEALVPLLGTVPVANLTGAVCRGYAKARNRAQGTIRKELGTLAAAINYCAREGYVFAVPKIWLPTKPAPRDRWLTRDEAAKLLRAAYRNPKTRHLCRFILVAIYSGTRSEAILSMRFIPNTQGGWVDLEAGVMYRRGAGQAETKKRTPPVPIPPRLLGHLRRWHANGARHVVEYEGCRVGSVKHAWATALRQAGIEHCTRHDLRHTAITWAMQKGADKWGASGFFGLSFDMLEKVYGHHHPDHMHQTIEAIGRRA